MSSLPWAYGGPPLHAELRQTPDDFIVIEQLGFSASGAGEHILLTVRKRNTNTDWLAQQLADFAGVRRNAVSYAGLKDRHAVTTQSFSIQMPGQAGPDWSQWPLEDVEVLSCERHLRKLKRGALQGNLFEITLRDVQGDKAQAEKTLAAIRDFGVPNYFGEQRFGLGGKNIEQAEAMFQGKPVRKKTRSLLLSAARSQIFNAVLAERVRQGSWNQAMPGEVFSLNGSRSWFVPKADEDNLDQRLHEGDIHPSGPLWGQGDLPTQGALAELEQTVAAQFPILQQGLMEAGMEHDRRALRLMPKNLEWEWQEQDQALRLRFGLGPGCYATVILRELAAWAAA